MGSPVKVQGAVDTFLGGDGEQRRCGLAWYTNSAKAMDGHDPHNPRQVGGEQSQQLSTEITQARWSRHWGWWTIEREHVTKQEKVFQGNGKHLSLICPS